MAREVIIILCCDTDPDRTHYIDTTCDRKIEHIWRGVVDGIPKLKKITESFRDTSGGRPKFTWFLRSDEQMNIVYKNAAWPISSFIKQWENLREQGDELGWHPHLWRWNEEHRIWYQETDDVEWIKNCLVRGYEKFREYFNPTSVRMGWSFHSNFTMRRLDELGITVDLSAIPGFTNKEYIGNDTKMIQNTYDWMITPNKPYFPSNSDYRREKLGNEQELDILELPITTFRLPIHTHIAKLLKKLVPRQTRTKPRREMLMRTTKHPSFFGPGVKMKFMEAKKNAGPSSLISYFHPDELLPTRGLFSITNFKNNLKTIEKISKRYNIHYRFLTSTEAAKEIMSEIKN